MVARKLKLLTAIFLIFTQLILSPLLTPRSFAQDDSGQAAAIAADIAADIAGMEQLTENLDAMTAQAIDPVDISISDDSDSAGGALPTLPDVSKIRACHTTNKTTIEFAPDLFTKYYNIFRASSSLNQPGLLGTYFDNNDLTRPITSQIDPQINFTSWGEGSPDPGRFVNPETFSVRWSGKLMPLQTQTNQVESYDFYLTAKDGVRMWINDDKVINNWGNTSSPQERTGNYSLDKSKKYNIRIEYQNIKDAAYVKFEWKSRDGNFLSREIVPSLNLSPTYSNNINPQLLNPGGNLTTPAGQSFTTSKHVDLYSGGLLAEYFDEKKPANKLVGFEVAPSLNSATPPAYMNNNTLFSARYLGKIRSKGYGTYTFNVTSKDGIRLWIKDFTNSNMLLNEWTDTNGLTTKTWYVTLEADTLYDFKLERYYDASHGTPDPRITLTWTGPGIGITPTVIPSTQLFRFFDPVFNSGLFAQYYDSNKTVNHTPLLTQIDLKSNSFSFDYSGSQLPLAIGNSNGGFSVKWSGFIKPTISGDYKFTINNGGSNITKLLIQNNNVASGSKVLLDANKLYKFDFEYNYSTGPKIVSLSWENTTASPGNTVNIPASVFSYSNLLPTNTNQEDGIIARIYDNKKISASVVSYYEKIITDYENASPNLWPNKFPSPVHPLKIVNDDTFSAQWSGRFNTIDSGTHTFKVEHNDGTHLKVDDLSQNLINDWTNKNSTALDQKNKTLLGSKSYDLRMDFYQDQGPFKTKLTWSWSGGGADPGGIYPFTHPVASFSQTPMVTYVDDGALDTNGPYWYQISAVGNGGVSNSEWFFQDNNCGSGTPVINKLKVSQSGPVSDPNFASRPYNLTSGKQSNENGLSWLNPIDISVDASLLEGGNVDEYYVAFYDKAKSPQQGQPLNERLTFVSDVQNILKPGASGDPKNGFLLAYRRNSGNTTPGDITPTAGNPYVTHDGYFIYDSYINKWIDLSNYTANGYFICPNQPCTFASTLKLLNVIQNNPSIASWKGSFFQQFQSKDLFTAVYVKKDNNNDFEPDKTPVNE